MAAPPSVRAVLAAYIVFTAVFGVGIPAAIVAHYGVDVVPQDFYQMPIRGGDYVASYAAANRLLNGHSVYDTASYSTAETDPFARLYSYPPLHAWVFVPLAGLPFATSYLVWTAITVGLIIASCAMAATLTEAPKTAFVALILVYAQSTFLQFQIERGQTDAPTVFLLSAMLFLYLGRRRNIFLVALCLSLATLIKALPAAFILFFLLRREFRLLAMFAGLSAVFVLVTGVHEWVVWITEISPAYAGYFLGYNVDHSLYYFFEGLTHDLPSALRLARAAAVIGVALYAGLVLLNRDRNKLVLVELALLSTVIEVATPWSANYKLIILPFLFMAPLSLLALESVRARPVRYTLPLFVAFVLIVPYFGEYTTRVPYSLLANVVPAQVVPDNPLHGLVTDRKVALGLLVCLVYLFWIYARATLEQADAPRWAASRAWWRKLIALRVSSSVAVITGCVALATGAALFVAAMVNGENAAVRAMTRFGPERPVNTFVSVAGYDVQYTGPTHYTVTVVYHVLGAIPQNLEIYLHADTRDAEGKTTSTIGRNFFPSVITSFWPTGKYVVAATDAFFEPRPYVVNVGFFDLSNGQQYGEVSLGSVDFSLP